MSRTHDEDLAGWEEPHFDLANEGKIVRNPPNEGKTVKNPADQGKNLKWEIRLMKARSWRIRLMKARPEKSGWWRQNHKESN